ncbi:MAG: hypothetical protein KGY38_07430 [Desulfobacterales bacterium]|nr:hypothetical protein [Desulfobacterales bacterium]
MTEQDQTLLDQGQSGGEGGETEPHPSGLPNELASDPTVQKFMGEDGTLNTENLAKSYVNIQSMVGRDKIPLPKEDAPSEEWQQVFSKLGRPEDPNEYQINDPDDLPENLQLGDDVKAQIKQKAHELNLLPSQAQGVYEFFMGLENNALQQQQQQVEQTAQENEQALRKEWGNAYDAEINKAKKAMKSFVPEDVQDDFLQKYGNDPAVIRLLNKVGNQISEGSLKGESTASNFTMTPQEAQRRIESINHDKNHPYWKGEPNAVEEMKQLHAAAYPSE